MEFRNSKISHSVKYYIMAILLVCSFIDAEEITADIDYFLQPFSKESPWNQDLLTRYGINTRKDLQLEEVKMPYKIGINSRSWSIPFYMSERSDPKKIILLTESNKIITLRLPVRAKPAKGDDAHLAIMDVNNKIIHEFYKYNNDGTAKIYRQVKADGYGFAESGNQYIGTRASGGSAVGGLIRLWEYGINQPIKHALAIAVSKEYLKKGFVKPASSEDSFSDEMYKGDIEMGSHITLMSGIEIDKILVNKLAQKIAHAIYDYGAYVVDSGGREKLIFYAEPGFPTKALQSANQDLKKLQPYLVKIINH
ncbi:MAG: hypothetical protein ABW118_15055 [Candidatus Thiodiazotropha sp.]